MPLPRFKKTLPVDAKTMWVGFTEASEPGGGASGWVYCARQHVYTLTSSPVDTIQVDLNSFRSMSSDDASSTVIEVYPCSNSIPPPIYRHAAPSGPWPWVDFNTDFSASEPPFNEGDYEWSGYPQKLFGNWTSIPVARSQMLKQCASKGSCIIYGIDVTNDGKFNARKPGLERIKVSTEDETEFWSKLKEKESGECPRSGVMLGTNYKIEPFFFSSSANWIPSRYREEVQHKKGDHITVILPFIGTSEKKNNEPARSSSPEPIHRKNTIDVMAPLHVHGKHVLLIDLLAIHMIRQKDASTIITYHPRLGGRTTAKRLHQVMERAGGSVYWNKIFQESKDPTFFFLQILWYALYSWDEAFEVLYQRIKELEAILNSAEFNTSDAEFASMADRNHNLHSLQAHLLQYQTHLHDFEKSVTFVKENPNPALEPDVEDDTTKETMRREEEMMKREKELMERECDNLLSEITRLERKCTMFVSRLKNATDLAFAAVNIEDSRQTHKLTKATLRDSAAMKQISYLTMVFLPASFTASVFGMNVAEINPGSLETIARYVEVTISLTLLTTWIVIALQPYSSIHDNSGGGVWRRMAWPFYLSSTLCKQAKPPLSPPSSEKDSTSLRSLRGRGPRQLEGLHEEDRIGD
ncbi:hypothetical protein CY34DRAFT_10847 [Suillus luteus UH-Slu-Lm8-n1]|uniref:Uncharacterized protein n=1 Tax=Suillus luteus UH-Slu-Lm8-n1 TaxID=930992 RepID=A0A0D0A3S6_9AGAM|nr:hypothetical protein CY34DRAFT_10847 [Suillus luteus UH-Slu-Lm8-n1]